MRRSSAAFVIFAGVGLCSPLMESAPRVAGLGPLVDARLSPCRVSDARTGGTSPDNRNGTIQGTVVDEHLEPRAGATVTAQRVRLVNGEIQLAPDAARSSVSFRLSTVTNRGGEYRLAEVPPGRYIVRASLPMPEPSAVGATQPRTRSMGYGPTFHPGTTLVAQATVVRVGVREHVTGVDIPLDRQRLARISGSLLSMRGQLHAGGASVRLVSSALSGPARLESFAGQSNVDASGAFEIRNVPPGDYVLMARSIPARVVREIATTGRSGPLARDSESEFGAVPVSVQGEDIDNVSVALSLGGRIKGRVTIGSQPFEPRRQYIPVTAHPLDSDSLAAGASQAGVEKDGSFEISGLAGRFVLRVDEIIPMFGLVRVEILGNDVTDEGSRCARATSCRTSRSFSRRHQPS